jgi:hypothetical protein
MRLQFRHPVQPLLGRQLGGKPFAIPVASLKLFSDVGHVSVLKCTADPRDAAI